MLFINKILILNKIEGNIEILFIQGLMTHKHIRFCAQKLRIALHLSNRIAVLVD